MEWTLARSVITVLHGFRTLAQNTSTWCGEYGGQAYPLFSWNDNTHKVASILRVTLFISFGGWNTAVTLVRNQFPVGMQIRYVYRQIRRFEKNKIVMMWINIIWRDGEMVSDRNVDVTLIKLTSRSIRARWQAIIHSSLDPVLAWSWHNTHSEWEQWIYGTFRSSCSRHLSVQRHFFMNQLSARTLHDVVGWKE